MAAFAIRLSLQTSTTPLCTEYNVPRILNFIFPNLLLAKVSAQRNQAEIDPFPDGIFLSALEDLIAS
jgi:hypothetical protein